MTNNNDFCYGEFCGVEYNSETSKYALVALVIVAAVLIGVALASNGFSLTGTELLDNSFYMGI